MVHFLSLLCFASWLYFLSNRVGRSDNVSTKLVVEFVRTSGGACGAQSGGLRSFVLFLLSCLCQLARELILPSSEHPIMCVRYNGVRVRVHYDLW